MVKARDLERALGRAIGKALGRREASDDDNDAPNGEDLPHILVSSDNKRVLFTTAEDLNEEQQEPPIEESVTDVEGFPGGPHDTLVLRDFENHITLREHPELKLSSHGRKMAMFGRPTPEIEGLVTASGLGSLIETSSFHLPVREVTITLDGVASLLHLPIVGAFHSFEQLHVDDIVNTLVELLECWIYKNFPSVGSALTTEDYDKRRPRASRWISGKALPVSTYRRRLDRLTPDVV
ncbi:uncharacterized protein LOC114397054 [Glycine soja]|uniref:uncharacterized protein LOC114397054 n=1 Tax=Glycine soja TaxID=3848 RepID=UPI00103EC2D6|nr:uncharacterized protein LOC114397054 [Glycine soja]